MERYNEILKKQEFHHAPGILKKYGIICRQLAFGKGPAPLYLAKDNWTNRFDPERKTTVGVFCSIWVSPAMLEKKQFSYNIHSKAIYKLLGYKLVSQKFASDFRDLVASDVENWPNIRLDYGPTTLLQGKDTCELDSFAEKIAARIKGFVDIHHHVDSLLAESLR